MTDSGMAVAQQNDPTVASHPALDAMLGELKAAHSRNAVPSLKERRRILAAMLDGLKVHEDALLEALAHDLGKSEPEARLTEYFPIRKEIQFVRRNLGDWMRPDRRPTPLHLLGTVSEIVPQPKGVVLVISPWNFPLLLTIKPVISAIAAGNRVVVKPPEHTPETSKVMAEWLTASLPDDWVQVVMGGPAEAAHLTGLPFDHIFFTGGTVTGRKVMQAAAAHLTPLTLELGGKSPAIIDGTMSPAKVASRVAWGKALNAGQVCIAPDYLLIEEDAADSVLKAVMDRWTLCFDGDAGSSPEYGRIVNDAQFDRLVDTLEDAVAKGAQVVCGGQYDKATRFMAPTILREVTMDMRVMQEEVFGPLLPVLTWRDPEEVGPKVAEVKDQPLSLYLFSSNRKRLARWMDTTRSGTVGVGEVVVQVSNPDLPFGGIQASGMGRSNGRAAFEALSNQRSVIRKGWPLTSVPISFGPFHPAKARLVRWLSRYL